MEKIKLKPNSPLLQINKKVKEAMQKKRRDKYGFDELKIGMGHFYPGANIKTVSAAGCMYRAQVNPNFYHTCKTTEFQGEEGVVLKRISKKEWEANKKSSTPRARA